VRKAIPPTLEKAMAGCKTWPDMAQNMREKMDGTRTAPILTDYVAKTNNLAIGHQQIARMPTQPDQ